MGHVVQCAIMGMIEKTICRCDVCGHEWIQEGPKPPAICPSRKCRSSLWNGSRRTKPAPAAIVAKPARCANPRYETAEEPITNSASPAAKAQRQAKKAEHRAQTAKDCIAHLPETALPALRQALSSPPTVPHHPACSCLKCQAMHARKPEQDSHSSSIASLPTLDHAYATNRIPAGPAAKLLPAHRGEERGKSEKCVHGRRQGIGEPPCLACVFGGV